MEITFNWLAGMARQQGSNKTLQSHCDIDYDLLYDKHKNTVKHVDYLFVQIIKQ